MSDMQPGILAPVPPLARYLTFSLKPDSDPGTVAGPLRDIVDGMGIVLGIGQSLVLALGGRVEGLRTFPPTATGGIDIPSTPAALWFWLRGDDRGKLLHLSRTVRRAVAPAFRLQKSIEAFRFGPGLDLTGYEDGTENPQGDKAVEAAAVRGGDPGLDGSSFVAVLQWVHDLDRFESMKPGERDHVIGRRKSDNEEMDDAPPSAHVKRTAQESFEPEAFVLRRSMPWADVHGEGLVFTAFGKSFQAFEALLGRMVGAEDGITDALFRFTRPVTGAYFWCPPVANGRLDLEALGL
jgi:putative iron-dependent peroxidase